MKQIDSSQIHLWLAFLDEITDPRLLDEYRMLLNREELQRQQRFHFERDKNRFLVTRAVLRTVLSKYASINPREWLFATNEYGKPCVANDDAWGLRLSFNLAHTDGLIVLGVTCDAALGVDVENLRTRPACLEITDLFFASNEVAALSELPCEERHNRFFEYWTLKESYIKARGMGLAIPLDRVSFDLRSLEWVRLRVDGCLDDSPERWRFWLFRPRKQYLIAVCCEHTEGRWPTLTAMNYTARTVIPAEQPLPPRDPSWHGQRT